MSGWPMDELTVLALIARMDGSGEPAVVQLGGSNNWVQYVVEYADDPELEDELDHLCDDLMATLIQTKYVQTTNDSFGDGVAILTKSGLKRLEKSGRDVEVALLLDALKESCG